MKISDIYPPSWPKEGVFIKKKLAFFLIFISFFLVAFFPALSQELPPVVEIKFEGNYYVEDEELRKVIFTQPGEILSKDKIRKDMQAIYEMGYFSRIRVLKNEMAEGTVLIYEIEENPLVTEVEIRGVTLSETKKLKKMITLEKGKPWNYKKARESEEKILEYLKKRGYTQAKVTSSFVTRKEGTCLSLFMVEKGQKARVMEVEISGNLFFSAPQIRSLMRTRFKRYFDLQVLKEDMKKVVEKYRNSGFYFARFESPKFEFFEKHRVEWVRVFLKINEGKRFRMGKINIEGNQVFSDPELKEGFRPREGEIFDLSKFRESLGRTQDIYGERGYIYAVIDNELHFNSEKNSVDVKILIEENNQVRVGQIKVEGNKTTRWRVFNHTLLLQSGDIFNTHKIRESWRRLYNLGFFNKVEMELLYTSKPSILDLLIEVEEREKLGKFLLGASYSSGSGVEGFIQLSKDNLWGQGKMISIDWEFGERRNDYQLSYLDRWWRDTPTRLELNVYNRESRFYPTQEEGYKKRKAGVELSLGRPWFSNFTLFLSLKTERTRIDSIEGLLLPSDLEEEEKAYQSLKPALVWDSRSRDEAFNVYQGLYTALSLEKSGGELGGDVDFTKYLVETRTYFRYGRFWRAPILALRVRGKWGEKLPLDEEFHIGGQNTLRGYEENQFRGSRTVLGTLEFRVPLTRDFLAYLFLDAGRVWEDPEMKEYKFGFGFGLRMSTPLGIIRLDYGIGEEGKPRIYFGMGDVF